MDRHPFTVGTLRDILENFDDADIILTTDQNLLFKVIVEKKHTAAGEVVLIKRGARFGV